MSSRVKRSRKGQSEVIAAMILIPLLIVIFSTVVTNTFKTNVVGTSSLASRARFEQERASENLRAVWVGDADTGHCEIQNTGPVDVTVVRAWVGEDLHSYAPDGIRIMRGEDITALNGMRVDEIDYAVTSRGNVYPLKTMCLQSRNTINTITYSSGLFTSEDILNMTRLVGSEYETKKIVTKVSGVSNASVLYWSDYPAQDWYFNSGSGWVKDIDSYSSPPQISGTSIDNTAKITDLDNNGINEVTLVGVTMVGKNPPYTLTLTPINLGKGGTYDINITFIDLLQTRDVVDVIAIYFKLVAQLSTSPSQQITIGTAAQLEGMNGKAYASGSTAVGSYKAGTTNVFVATGSIFFPVKAYDPYKEVIRENETYNLTLMFNVNNPSSNPDLNNVRIEYVAVTGAELRWRP